MLTELYGGEKLGEILLSREAWCPFPKKGWAGLPVEVRRQTIERGEQALGFGWPSLRASQFLEYVRDGNRSRYQGARDRRRNALGALVLAECVEGEGRFLDGVVDGLWLICEESYWGVPAHLSMQRAGPGLPDVAEPTVDLFVGETAALLAWTHYLLGERLAAVSPLIGPRVLAELDRRVLVPCLEREDFWWMGFDGRSVNNWNPWCNSNWLTAALLCEGDAGRRLAAVAKSLKSLDRFIDPYPADGGCDEGPSYWGRAAASLFDCLELLHGATGGALDVYDRPLIQEMGRFIYRAHIDGEYYLNFADAPARVKPSGALVYRYGRRIGDAAMVAFGAWLGGGQPLSGDSMGRVLPALFARQEMAGTAGRPPLMRDVWLPHIQVMAARDQEGSAKGLYLAAKGGHNAESHNHNDIGTFVLYRDGRPVLVDAGVEEYTAKTFSARRYEIWTMQSAYHNLPAVGGVDQRVGRDFAAADLSYRAADESACLRLDIAGAYPEEAGLLHWVRTLTLYRGQYIEVREEYSLRQAVPRLELNLLTPCAVRQAEEGLQLQEKPLPNDEVTGSVLLSWQGDGLQPEVEEVPVEDRRLRSIWGESLWRIRLVAIEPPPKGEWMLRLAPT